MSADRPAGLFGRLLRTMRPEPSGSAAAQPVVRRLAAILAADMVGYSRLMGLDEVGTLAALRGLRQQIIDPTIAAQRGRIVKTTGDGLLAEFASVVDAVQCAIEMQRAMAMNMDAPPDKRIEFRIGVNLGEIIFEGDDIYGDGVNIAARLEQLAQPGSVCISHTVYKECRGRIEASYTDGGERELKNIAKLVHVWHWQSAPAAAAPQIIAAAEGKPSIAVLPFVNMSSDKEQEYFADGMTEDIITGLSFDSRLFVIARNSTFAYKGQSPDIRTAGKELGVRYVVEGSIRPMGDRLRITAQLIDTATGNHVWADKIDRPAAEIFAISDEVVDGLVTALGSNLSVAEGKRAARQRPEDLQAWALCVRAEAIFHLSPSEESRLAAEKLLRRATEIEPGYGASWAVLAKMTSLRHSFGSHGDPAKAADEALALAGRALSLAPQDPLVLGYCGAAYAYAGETTKGLDCLERSLELNPNSGIARVDYGRVLLFAGRPEASIAQLDVFLRQSPKDPFAGFAHFFFTMDHLILGEFQQAEHSAHRTIMLIPSFVWGYIGLAMSLTGLERAAEAQQQIQKLRQIDPAWTRQHAEDFWRRILKDQEQLERSIMLLRRACPD